MSAAMHVITMPEILIRLFLRLARHGAADTSLSLSNAKRLTQLYLALSVARNSKSRLLRMADD